MGWAGFVVAGDEQQTWQKAASEPPESVAMTWCVSVRATSSRGVQRVVEERAGRVRADRAKLTQLQMMIADRSPPTARLGRVTSFAGQVPL